MVSTLFSDNRETESLNKLCRLNATGTSVHTSEARETFIYGRRILERLDVSGLYHINKLMGVILHLIVGGAGAGALTALHTFEGIDSAHAKELFLLSFGVVVHITPPLHREPQREAR